MQARQLPKRSRLRRSLCAGCVQSLAVLVRCVSMEWCGQWETPAITTHALTARSQRQYASINTRRFISDRERTNIGNPLRKIPTNCTSQLSRSTARSWRSSKNSVTHGTSRLPISSYGKTDRRRNDAVILTRSVPDEKKSYEEGYTDIMALAAQLREAGIAVWRTKIEAVLLDERSKPLNPAVEFLVDWAVSITPQV